MPSSDPGGVRLFAGGFAGPRHKASSRSAAAAADSDEDTPKPESGGGSAAAWLDDLGGHSAGAV